MRDWSWKRTRRRLGLLARLTLPYRGRTALALGTLLVYTLVALAPPYLAKLAIDEGIRPGDLGRLTQIVVLFLAAALLALALSGANTYLTGWTGERVLADLRNKLFGQLQRLSLGFYERNRAGVIISRITNDVEALDQLVTDGVTSLIQNTLLLLGTAVVLFFLDVKLALATLTVLVPMALVTAWFRSRSNRAYRNVRERLGLVTATLAEDIAGMRVVQSFTREPVQQKAFHGVNDRYRAANYETIDPERDLLPRRRPARDDRDGDRVRLRRLARLPRRDDHRHAVRLRALPLELLRPDPAALAALQHVPLRDRRAGQDHRRARRGAAGGRPRRRARAAADRRARPLRGRPLRLRAGVPGGAARARARRARRARRSPSSATPAPASRRSRS